MSLPTDPLLALRYARKYLSQNLLAKHLHRSLKTIQRWEAEETPVDPIVLPALRELLENPQQQVSNFTFIDLFAGIGGIRMAFESVGGQCVFTSENNKYSNITYKANFADRHDIAGDITAIHESTIPDHDVLLAGFPCQPFSLAGVSKKNSLGRAHGFECKTQGTLFFDICRIIREKRPKAFLLENVKNLKSHDKGNTFRVITEALQELGYQISLRVIDARHWVPQHRERIFIIGWREQTDFSLDQLDIPTGSLKLRDILHQPNEPEEDPYTTRINGKTVVSPRYTLTDKLWIYLQNYAAKHAAKGNGFGCSVVTGDDTSRTLSARYHKDGSEILISQGPGRNPRRLTPRECARLMGFDHPIHNDKPPFRIPVSDTQAYRQFGNAVAVPVVVSIAQAMRPHLVKS